MMGFVPKQSFLTCKNVLTENFSQLQDPQSTKYLNDEEEPATHKGHTMLQVKMHVSHGQNYGAAYNAIINQCFFSYASWLCLFQAVALSYAKQVVKLMDSVLMARKTTVDVNKELNTLKMGASLLHKTVIFSDIFWCCHLMLL